ncbi:hypothetical protein KXV92_009237 [Aspergillus fumigatus]|nr:hypothetical protein KXX57_005243 [Aspergillus fumigatus]KAH1976237.1 hypothetical protein KXW88_009124 [Aspergillus fumigatus]KAH2304846.1 hypothetical protein KXV47_008886 [Aspergillus fumigatus]KAH2654639.1 hypothetical protein KXV32_002952 [Aspergillus fumigatus]KAH2748006.1 hypothetical protein KXV94_004781 [Aspergillus fumigatus]
MANGGARAHGLHLHGQCSRVVLLEPSLILTTVIQAPRRVLCLGQRVSQKAWTLFQGNSISHLTMDQVQQHRRGAPQLTPSFMTCSKPLLPAATRPAATGDTIECGNKSDGNDAKAKFIQRHAEESNIWTASDKNGSWTRSTTSGKLRNSGAWQ